jgi:hypothetical protein
MKFVVTKSIRVKPSLMLVKEPFSGPKAGCGYLVRFGNYLAASHKLC